MMITVNEPGARTIAEARPMQIDGQNVYVVVEDGTASLIVSGLTVARLTELTANTMTTTEAQAWAVEYRTGLAAVEDAVQSVRDAGEMIAKQAGKLAATATDAPYRFRNSRGRSVTVNRSDPRHPFNACKTMLNQAEIMMAWTAQDERAYIRYISDGIGDTDGYFAPVDRPSWKTTQSA